MKFLNIDEKKKLLSEGKSIPLRVKQDPNAEKERKKLIAELQKNFSDTINNGKPKNNKRKVESKQSEQLEL